MGRIWTGQKAAVYETRFGQAFHLVQSLHETRCQQVSCYQGHEAGCHISEDCQPERDI